MFTGIVRSSVLMHRNSPVTHISAAHTRFITHLEMDLVSKDDLFDKLASKYDCDQVRVAGNAVFHQRQTSR